MSRNKIILLCLVFLMIVAGSFVMNVFEAKKARVLDQKIASLDKRLGALQDNVGSVGGELRSVSSKQQQTGLELKELQNREVVKQKSQDELLTAAVAKVSPAVVSIVVSKDVPKLEVVYQNPFGNDPFFKNFNIRVPVYQQKGVERQKVGAGTGFIITADGYIFTNKHVVADTAASYTVLLADGKQKDAEVVYRDTSIDVAIIKISGSGYAAVSLGNSSTLKLGQTVVAIGNALGEYNNSVSVGIISGLNRTIEASGEKLDNVIQTDAAINLGNSGGPLVDLDGRVVGINVATVVSSSNISFSIPINTVKSLLKTVLGK